MVPMLLQLEERLERVRDARDLPKVVRIAAVASLLIVEKYLKLSELSEVYCIAIGAYSSLLDICLLTPYQSDVSR